MPKNIVSIPPSFAAVDVVAQRLLKEAGDNPLRLTDTVVILPTRRACRSLQEAFVKYSKGKAILLPRMLPVSNLEDTAFFADEEIPEAVSPLERKMLLMRLIMAKTELYGLDNPTPETAAFLADSLALFLDEAAKEEIDLNKLQNIVPENLAKHWQDVLKFLEIIIKFFPQILAEKGLVNPSERMVRLVRKRTREWQKNPPSYPVVAVGITGSLPVTAELLNVIASLPKGLVVLPALDSETDDESWAAITPSHPQYEMKKLLDFMGVNRQEVGEYIEGKPLCGAERIRFVKEILRPSAVTDKWLEVPAVSREALKGVEKITLESPVDEALAVALIMRKTLEEEGKQAILVTNNRDLARRVAVEMQRFGINLDDSAGSSLALTPVGVFLNLLAEAAASGMTDRKTLALLKHPLAACNMARIELKALLRKAEKQARNNREEAPLAMTVWNKKEIDFNSFVSVFTRGEKISLRELVTLHMRLAEDIATTDETSGEERLWCGEAGRKAAEIMAELAEKADIIGEIDPFYYPALVQNFMNGEMVRPVYGTHPRLAILGPIEARLQKADVVILAGMNEGSFPSLAEADPWMSMKMRDDCGLSSKEEKTGIAALDFMQLFCAPKVVITRAEKEDGAPSVPSRWLLRMEALETVFGIAPDGQSDESLLQKIVKEIDRPKTVKAWPAPTPRPKVEARPRQLPVTAIETLMRDPYAIYAKYILKLYPLKDLERQPGRADFGSAVHKVFQIFIDTYQNDIPDDAQDKITAIGHKVFAETGFSEAAFAFWWPSFLRAADWFIEMQKQRKEQTDFSGCEISGKTVFSSSGGDFTLTANADRIDVLKNGAGIDIIDYKTGTVPSPKVVAKGFAPQLPLEGMIALNGGFGERIKSRTIHNLSFWKIAGTENGCREENAIAKKDDIDDAIKAAQEGIEELITAFDRPSTSYEATPRSEFAPTYSDYEHLERVKEWSAGKDVGEE